MAHTVLPSMVFIVWCRFGEAASLWRDAMSCFTRVSN